MVSAPQVGDSFIHHPGYGPYGMPKAKGEVCSFQSQEKIVKKCKTLGKQILVSCISQ